MLQARTILTSGDFDLVVLDELNGALDFGLVDLEQVMELIALRPPQVELIITGRNAHPQVVAVADLVTEMREIKHYYKAGVPARSGIEM